MSSQCLNGGQSIVNQFFNETYCQCGPCHQGVHCEDLIPYKEQMQFNTDYVYLIICLIKLCLSLLNNLLSLAVFQGSKRVRRTNIGIYLTLYSIIAIIGNVLLVVGQFVQYFKPYPFVNNEELSETFDCFVDNTGNQVISFVSLWLSAFVAFDHALIIGFNCKLNGTRWRSIVVSLIGFCVTAATSIPMMIYRCEWSTRYKTPRKRITSGLFYTVAVLAGFIYVLAILLVLINFALRMYKFGNNPIGNNPTGDNPTDNNPNGNNPMTGTKIFCKLLRSHLFIFIPPVVYLVCAIPYQIWFPRKGPTQPYLHCGISTVQYVFKVIVQALPYIPPVITWLIFIYPSNVYMTEFYTKTWIGKIWVQGIAMISYKVAQRSS